MFCSGRRGMIDTENKERRLLMTQKHWSSLADLEDLIYENQKLVASER